MLKKYLSVPGKKEKPCLGDPFPQQDKSHGLAWSQIRKDQLNQAHINESSSGNRKKHLPFPQVQRNHTNGGDEFRQTMVAGKQADIFETIDHQHAENCGGQYLAQVPDKGRCWPVIGENKKRQKTGQHGAQDNHADRDQLLRNAHQFSYPTFSKGRRKRSRRPRIPDKAGIKKSSRPNTTRHKTDIPMPIRAVSCRF